MQIKILSISKLVSFESLAGNDFSERGTQAEAHCERNLNRQLWKLDEKYRIAVQGIFSVHRLVVWLPKKTGVLARWLFAFVFKDLCTENRGKLPRKISRQRKNRDFSILNSRAPSQNNKTSRTSCRRLFENFLFLRQQKNRNFSIFNLSAPSQNNKTSRTSCRCHFENFLPSTPTYRNNFKISFNAKNRFFRRRERDFPEWLTKRWKGKR